MTDIIAKSEAAFECFKTNNKRPTNLYVTQIYDAIAKIFPPICYDSVGAKQNLMGLIDEDPEYATEYGKWFLRLSRPCIYASPIVCIRTL